MKIRQVNQFKFLSDEHKQEMLDSLNSGGTVAEFFCSSNLFLTSNTASDDQIEHLKSFLQKVDRIVAEKLKSKSQLLGNFSVAFVLPHETEQKAAFYMRKHYFTFTWNKKWNLSCSSQNLLIGYDLPLERVNRVANQCACTLHYVKSHSDARDPQYKELVLGFSQYLANQKLLESALEQSTIYEELRNVD